MTRFFILITLLTALLLPSAALAAQAPQTALVAVDTLNILPAPVKARWPIYTTQSRLFIFFSSLLREAKRQQDRFVSPF